MISVYDLYICILRRIVSFLLGMMELSEFGISEIILARWVFDSVEAYDQALLNNVGGSTIAAFDDTKGEIFAVASSELRAVMLYATDVPDAVSLSSIYRSQF